MLRPGGDTWNQELMQSPLGGDDQLHLLTSTRWNQVDVLILDRLSSGAEQRLNSAY